MRSNFIKKLTGKSTISLLLVLVYLVSFTYANGVYSLAQGADPASIDFWDGTDNYTSLNDVLAVLEKDSDDCYHITEAAQLHAVIKYNGGGHSFKLDRDIAINTDYENYANWGTNAPANEWSFGTSNWYSSIGNGSFRGIIDGCKHTIYGLYSNGSKAYNGLIPQVGAAAVETTVIKNLNVWYSYVKVNGRAAGILIGSTYNGNYSTTVDAAFIEGCSVRYAAVDVPEGNSVFGGIVGLSRRKTTISCCYVADIVINPKFTPGGTSNNYGGLCSIVGSIYESNVSSTAVLNTNQAKLLKISNCYAVNVVNTATDNQCVYVAGVFNSESNKWGFCISAYNIYTDSTTVSHANSASKKLLVSLDGEKVISAKNENYPIRTITANEIKGDSAMTAMPLFDWNKWKTVSDDYPQYVGKIPLAGVWDGKDSYEDFASLLSELGEPDEEGYYHITNPNQLHAAIRFQGGGNKFRVDNDLYLNDDYENYESWGSTAPKNTWQFNQASNWNASSMTPFTGTIDGCGHTIYGLFSNTTGNYNGLIGATTGDTVIKNISVCYAYLNAKGRAGVIVGCKRGGTLEIDRCSVSYVFIKGSWENVPAGGMVGVIYPNKTQITNCAVSDVKFTGTVDKANASSKENPYAFGSFIGAVYMDMQTSSYAANNLNRTQASNAVIQNSYAVNVINETNAKALVYVCGLFHEGTNSSNNTKWGYCITAKDVYTDATVVPASNLVSPQVKLMVTMDGMTAIPVDDEKYPIKTITAASIIGESAKSVLTPFDWCKWNTVAGYYPTPHGKHILANHPIVPATCDEIGTEEYWKCIECGKMFSDGVGESEITQIVSIDPLHHKNSVHYTAKEAGCTDNGNIEYWYCPDCKKYSTDSDFTEICEQAVVIISKINHEGGLMHYTQASATCDEDGHIEYWHCVFCDKYYTDSACKNEISAADVITDPAKGHKSVFRSATEASDTCIQPGTISHWECIECNRWFEDKECTKELFIIDAPSNLHIPKKVNEKKATCYENGRAAHYECTTCHRYFTDPNCQCQVTLSSLTIPAIKHGNAKLYSEMLPGCTTTGLKQHWYCPDCESYFSKSVLSETNKINYSQLIIPANGHTTSEDTVVGYNSSEHWQVCDVCGAEINKEFHIFADPVTVYDGNERRCKCGYGLQQFNYNVSGVNISADYGVFDADVSIKVAKVTDGLTYEKAATALQNVSNDIDVYKFSAKKGRMAITPQGQVKIELPVSKRYSANVAIYSVDESGNATILNADINRKDDVAKLTLYGLKTLAVVDVGVPYNPPLTEAGYDSDTANDNSDYLYDGDIDIVATDSEDDLSESVTSGNESASNKKQKKEENEGLSATLIFIAAVSVGGFIIVTFGTVLIIHKVKKHNKEKVSDNTN